MESLDPISFLSSLHPFDFLKANQLVAITESMDIFYFKVGDKILLKNSEPEFYYIIAKGAVRQVNDTEEETTYGPKDSFDAPAVLSGKTKDDFEAMQETICFAIPARTFKNLIQTNSSFESYYLQDISKRMDALLNQSTNKAMATFMIGKVSQSYIRPVVIVDEDLSIIEAVTEMTNNKSTSLIVSYKDGKKGVVSDSDLRKRVILQNRPYTDKISTIATKKLVTIEENTFLFNALVLMTEHVIKRLAVTNANGEIIGMLEQLDLISAMSHKSYLIHVRIQKATNIKQIKEASDDLVHLMKSLQTRGIKVRQIIRLLSELNAKIYQKIFEFTAPQELIDNSCLILLGSEGRKEQTLKTDQDNGIILRDGYEFPNIQEVTNKFTQALEECGYPRCEGNIMVSNPFWTKSVSAYKKEVQRWVNQPDGESLMNLAIFFDSRGIAGDLSLIDDVKNYLFKISKDDVGFLANFSKATLLFETPLGIFSNFLTAKDEHKNEIDIKKGGVFPIVHAVRSLALENKISKTNTIERIRALTEMNILDKELSEDLIEAFSFLLTLRLTIQIKKYEAKEKIDNYIAPDKLSKIERDILRDVFKIVDRLKKYVSNHFRLSLIS